jgi:hypothetical protein
MDGRNSVVTLIAGLTWWNERRQIAAAPALVGHPARGRAIGCWISRDALEQLERGRLADAERCLGALARHRSRLEAIAARRYAAGGLDGDNCLRITAADVAAVEPP